MNWIIWPPTTFTVPMQPLKPERRDSEYVRKGTCSIFVFTEPLAGWRHLSVEERRTKVDGAHQVRELLVVHYPNAGKIKLVMDNWNTHNLSSLYEAFDPETALNLAKRLEIHYTPKHGSWLNIAEIELSVMTRQCLGRRIADVAILRQETGIMGIQTQSHTKGCRLAVHNGWCQNQIEKTLSTV